MDRDAYDKFSTRMVHSKVRSRQVTLQQHEQCPCPPLVDGQDTQTARFWLQHIIGQERGLAKSGRSVSVVHLTCRAKNARKGAHQT